MAPDPSNPPAPRQLTTTAPAPPWTLVLLAGIALLAGLLMLADGDFGFSPEGVVSGVLSQLTVTLPAAVIVLVAAAVNVFAGAILVWVVRGHPYEGLGELFLAGWAGAVMLDLVLLGALGGTGTFRWPVLALVHVVIVVGGHLLRLRRGNMPLAAGLPTLPPLRSMPGLPGEGRRGSPAGTGAGGSGLRGLIRRPAPPADWPLWAAAGIAWSGALLLQLASPVVPYLDVLPNHVAPVEHLRTFGEFATVTTTASPIYGPSRSFLGYIAMLGVVDTLSTLPAALAVGAFALPGAVAVAVGLRRLTRSLGAGEGAWTILAFVITVSFVRLPDARATVLVLPLVAWALALLADRAAGRLAATPRTALLVGGTLGAAISFHPVIGALAVLAVGLVTAALPRRTADLAVPALVTAGLLALPQLGTMVELAVPTAVALVAVPLAIAAGWLTARSPRLVAALVVAGRLVLASGAIVALVAGATVLPAAVDGLGSQLTGLPILLGACLVGLLLRPSLLLNPVLVAALVTGAIAATATNLVPADGTLMTALRFEVPKTLHYWFPVFLAVGAGLALDAAWREDRLPLVLPSAAVAIFVLVSFLPLRSEPLTDAYTLDERRVSETVSLQLQLAESGYWRSYPDSRTLVAPDQVQLLDAVRAEISAGRLGARDQVLHVARSFQQWSSTPLGVFAGVLETDITPDAEVSIHTVGGRLHPFEDLGTLLRSGAPYLVLEPADLPAGTRAQVVTAGYRSIFANGRGELFRLARASGAPE